MPPMTTTLQWNCRSFSGKIDYFKVLLGQYNCNAFALSETWLSPDKNITFPGYNIVRQDRHDPTSDRRGGGVLIGIRSSHSFSRIPLPTPEVIEYSNSTD